MSPEANNSTKPVVLVLEDQEVRVDWLRDTFPDFMEIIWSKTVSDFLQSCKDHAGVTAVAILDHDLGFDESVLQSEDVNGQTGTDAARLMLPVPYVVIWSMNPGGSRLMRDILRDKKQRVRYAPFASQDMLAGEIFVAVSNFKKLQK